MVLSVHRDEQQFFELRRAFEQLFHKWQETRQIGVERDITKRKHTTRGVIDTGREERMSPLRKVA